MKDPLADLESMADQLTRRWFYCRAGLEAAALLAALELLFIAFR